MIILDELERELTWFTQVLDLRFRLYFANPADAPGPTAITELPPDNAAAARPERRAPPEPRDVEPQGPPLQTGRPGPTVDPSLSHPVFAAAEARAQVAAAAAGHGQSRPSPGPSRIRRRAVGGIGGAGVKVGTPITQRRDVIVGKYASEHQAQLDEEILALLRDDV